MASVRAQTLRRVKRFKSWDSAHQERFLGRLDMSREEFDAMDASRQNAIISRGVNRAQRTRERRVERGRQQSDPAAFTEPLSRRAASRQALTAANLEYGGAERALAQHQVNVPGWYQDYRAQLSGLATQAAQRTAPVVASAQQRAVQAGQVAPVPAGVDPSSPAAQDASLAAQSRGAMGTLGAQMLEGLGVTTQDALTLQSANAGRAQIAEQDRVAGDVRALKREKGQYRATELERLREGERGWQDTLHRQQLEGEAFGLDVAEAESEARDRAADNRRDRREAGDDFLSEHGVSRQQWRSMGPEQRAAWNRYWKREPRSASDRLNEAKLDYFETHGYFPQTGPGNGRGGGSGTDRHGNTRSQRIDVRDDWRRSVREARGFDDWREAYDWVLDQQQDVDSLVAKAAAQWQVTGRISPKLRARVRKLGAKLPKDKPRATISPPGSAPSGQSNNSGNETGRPG